MNTNHEAKLIRKEDAEEQRMVWAEVYAPNRPDADGEYMTAETIRKMAYNFARHLRLKAVDLQHNNETTEGVQVVETFIARKDDPDFIAESWVVGVHVADDQIWQDIKDGKINGFSVQALVVKETKEVELELPPVVVGKTSKEQDHEHKFFVSYDAEGKFLGGETDEVDGHKHLIRRGTVTETSNDHTHRFSSVDNVEIVNG